MLKNSHKKVSIIIPVYNGSDYLSDAIESALNQTYDNIEILVIDDGSCDGGKTETIALLYGKKVRYIKKKNGGVASALNLGIKEMTGEYFSWLSHDDLYYPEKIEKQIDLLNGLEDKETIIFSGYDIVNANGQFVERIDFSTKYDLKKLNNSLYPFFHLALNGCSMLIHKNHFQSIGFFNENLPTTQDYDLWFRLLKNANIQYSTYISLKSRSHPKQGSTLLREEHIKECNSFWVKVLKPVSTEEMISLEGSVENFYRNIRDVFKNNTSYNKVIGYLESQLLKHLSNEYLKELKIENYSKISKEIYKGDKVESKTLKKVLTWGEKKKQRLFFYTGNWADRGGINRVIAAITSSLSKDYEVILCYTEADGNRKGYPINGNVKILEITEGDFMYIPSLCSLLNVDIFVGSNNLFMPLLFLYPEFENLGIRVIAWNHEHFFLPYYDKKFSLAIELRKKVFNEISVVLWQTNYSGQLCKTFIKNVGVIPNSVSLKRPLRDKKVPEFDLITVGRFDSLQKRLDLILETFTKIAKQYPKIRLCIVGKYDLEMKNNGKTINQQLAEMGKSSENIVFTGEVEDVSKYYENAKINIATSEREGFGLTVVEAALFGVPSIVLSGGGQEEIITNGVNGYIVENTSEIARQIGKLVENGDLYKQMSKKAILLSKNYKIDTIVKKWKMLIDILFKVEDVSTSKVFDSNLAPVFSENMFDWSVNAYEEFLNQKEKDFLLLKSKSYINRLTLILKKGLILIKKQGIFLTTKNIVRKVYDRMLK